MIELVYFLGSIFVCIIFFLTIFSLFILSFVQLAFNKVVQLYGRVTRRNSVPVSKGMS